MGYVSSAERADRFTRTQHSALVDMRSRWDLIEAIADDANSSGLHLSGIETVLAAHEAIKRAGNDLALDTVRQMCVLAMFYDDSTPEQRELWRTYGWTIVRDLAKAGWSQTDSAELLGAERRSRDHVSRAIAEARGPGTPAPELSIDEQWQEWLYLLNRLTMLGARAAERTENEAVVLGTYSALARLIHERLTERDIDAELRNLFDGVAADTGPAPLPPLPPLRARFDDDIARRTGRAFVSQIQAAETGEWEPSAQTRLMWTLIGGMLGGTQVDWDADLAHLIEDGST